VVDSASRVRDLLIFTAEVVCGQPGLPQRSVATAAATGGAIAAGGGFFTEKDVIVEGAFEGICLPLHFYPGEIAPLPGPHLGAGCQKAGGQKQ